MKDNSLIIICIYVYIFIYLCMHAISQFHNSLELTSHEKEYDLTNHFQSYNPFELTSHEKQFNIVLSNTSCNYDTV